MIKFQSGENFVSFQVKAQPRASRTGVAGELDGALKIRLASPPVEGEANEELIRFLAKLLDVPRSNVRITSGQTSRTKIIRVFGVTAELCDEKIREVIVDS